jgi:hypothetical protein
MGLNEIKNEFGTEIADMANDLSNSLPFSKPELRKAFTDGQIEDLHKLISEVNAATSQNEKIARLQDNIKTAFSLLKKLGVAL